MWICFLSGALPLIVGYYLGKVLFQEHIQHGPDSNNIKNNVYHSTDIGCYEMSPIAHICPFHAQRN